MQGEMFLLVVVLLFFSSIHSVSSHQYYVSDDCSSVTHTPCHPLSVYAENISQYNNSIFYFAGTNTIPGKVSLIQAQNITFEGMDDHSVLNCTSIPWHPLDILIKMSSHIKLIKISFTTQCVININIYKSRHTTIANCNFQRHSSTSISNGFDVNILNTKLYDIKVVYTQSLSCQSSIHQYQLSLKNVTVDYSLYFHICHGRSYKVNVITENVESNEGHFDAAICTNSLYHINITNVSSRNAYNGLRVLYHFEKTDDYFLNHRNHVQSCSKLIIENSQFDDNMKGLSILKLPIYNGEYVNNVHHVILVKSCQIRNNKRYGLFIENYSSAATNGTKYYTISINDTEIIGNKQNGLIYTDVLLNNVSISNSRATGLSILGSTVKIDGSVFITNNIGKDGGGMAIHDDSIIFLLPNTLVNISNNHATHKGGGVYFRNRITCLFDSDMSVQVHMLNNTAVVAGDDSYGNIVNEADYCLRVFQPEVIKLSSDAVDLKFCDPENTTIERYNKSIPEKEIFPGQKLKFYIAMQGIGFIGEYTITDGVIDINIDDEEKLKEVQVNTNCSLVEFTPSQTELNTLHNVTLTIHQYFDQFPLSHGGIPNLFDDSWTPKLLQFNYSVNPCPIGFTNNSSKCICRENISKKGAKCNINTQTIEHDGKKWIGKYNDTSTCFISEACLLHCASTGPVSFTMDRPDAQCDGNRGELMCGLCRKSLLLGSNRCDECKNPHLTALYILIFGLMGILLVILLIVLNLTVSNGMLNGLLFYANIIKLYEPIFSCKEYFKTSEYVSLVIASWSNLDFGFEVCFYEGMNRYLYEWLQFVFPFYLWSIIIIIIALSWKYGKVSRLVGSHTIPVLSTLLLLSYTKLIHTIVIVLHKRKVTLHCPDSNDSNETLSLWYEDPTLEYGKGKHAGLLAFAILVLITFIIPYTLFLLLGQLYEKYLSNFKILKKFWGHSKYLCFKPIIDAYSGPMKDKYRFWPGLLLVARIPLLLSVTLVDSYIESESLLLCMLLIVVASLLSLHVCFGGFYRKRVHNIVEVWFLLNLCIMVGLAIVFEDDEEGIWFIICISIFNLSFISMIFHHAHLQLLTKKWYRKLWSKKRNDDVIVESETEEHKTVFIQMSEIVPTSMDLDVACRESVVELY